VLVYRIFYFWLKHLAKQVDFFGRRAPGVGMSLDELDLPLFTSAMGLWDGFNPCFLWVLLMISLLASMNDRIRMFAIAGIFVAVEGLVYFISMAAWINLFLPAILVQIIEFMCISGFPGALTLQQLNSTSD
jgi:hypothetical protein